MLLKKLSSFVLVFSLFLLTACKKKEERKHWLVFDLETVDIVNNKPVQCNISLLYWEKQSFGAADVQKSMSVGTTDGSGKMYYENKMPRKQSEFDLIIFTSPYYTVNPIYISEFTKVNLDQGEKNDVRVELIPLYPYQLHIVNSSCTGTSDQATLSSQNLYLTNYSTTLSGCADNVIKKNSDTPVANFQVIRTKSGVTDTLNYTFNLQAGIVNPIQIDY